MSTYLLIHGSWHGAWCWYKITARLEAAGHTVIVPDLPSHGRDWTPPGQLTMQDYVDTVTRILDAAAEPVVLVVHSRNGIVAAQAAEARPERIRTLVYLASYLPPIGDTAPLAQSRGEGQWAHDPGLAALGEAECRRQPRGRVGHAAAYGISRSALRGLLRRGRGALVCSAHTGTARPALSDRDADPDDA